MKRIFYLFIGLIFHFQSQAQSITAYKYWFDNGSPTIITGSFGPSFDLNLQVATVDLSSGLHTYSIGFQDSNGLWSSFTSSFFYKLADVPPAGQAQYEYWYDSDYANKVNTNITSTNNLNILADLNTDALSNGLHTLNMRFKPDGKHWSSAISSFFYKANATNGNITKYEYWFDSDYVSKVVTNTTATTNLNLSANLSTTNLSTGLHVLHTRFMQSNGVWSSATSDFFVKENGIANNKLVKYRYWFDSRIQNAKEIYLSGKTAYDLQNAIDCEELSLGRHLISIQVKDLNGLWSSVVADSISRGVIGVKNFIEPKVLTSKGTLNVGDTQLVSGKDFTPNGQINLSIINELGENIAADNLVNYINDGKFSYNLLITNASRNGEYTVSAADVSTGKVSPTIKFKVNNAVVSALWINEPAGEKYLVNQDIPIQWGAFIDKTVPLGKSGFVQKKYKVELSNDNGNTWTIIKSEVIFNNGVHSTNNNAFKTTYNRISIAGMYKIRVSDLENINNVAISEPFEVVTKFIGGFDYSFEWDKSGPKPNGMPHPLGMAADGTSRIFIKLKKSGANNKIVKRVRGIIMPVNDSFLSTDLLGKIKYSTNHDEYNEEANSANSIIDYSPTDLDRQEYWFWLVAPDDFTHDQNSELIHREITVSFLVTYSDGTTEPINLQNTIKIVRPPLFMVHGLNGSSKTFQNFKYDVGNGLKYFDGDGNGGIQKNPVWKEAQRLDLYNYASFANNAEVILGLNYQKYNYYNTFNAYLNAMHNKGYASNRVDYVAHSMGGNIARTIVMYENAYKPAINDITNGTYKFGNYSKGFINKLITLDTPHNGSPWANFLQDYVKLQFKQKYNHIGGFFVFKKEINTSEYLYVPSPAIRNLQSGNNGIKFPRTVIKNHLIGGDIDRYNTTDALLLVELNSNFETRLLVNFALSFSPMSVLKADKKINSFNNFISSKYNYPNFLSNSDFVVPMSSQFPYNNLDEDNIPEVENINIVSSNSVGYGIGRNHILITDDLAVGTKVMRLLNSPINSGYFADDIAANPNYTNSITEANSPKQETVASATDSIKNYFDKVHIEIISPLTKSIAYIDSTIQVQINLKDTTHLTGIRLAFQSEFYDSYSKVANQTFDFKVHSNAIGKNIVFAEATYDSLGFTVNHVDTISLNIKSKTALKGFYASPKTVYLNPQQTFTPTYNAVYDSFVGQLNNDIDSLSFVIADTNVICYDKTTSQFIAKDSSSTHITFNYKGFTDKIYIILSLPTEIPCPPILTLTANYPIGQAETFQASEIINNLGTISNGANILNRAGNIINLIPPFKVEAGGIFKTEIGGCQE